LRKTNALLSDLLIAALLAALVVDAGCNRGTRRGSAASSASSEIPGWVKSGDTRVFEAADLWKYVDGDAERYLKFGVQRVQTADYKFQNKIEATVDIYTMANAEGARKLFESEPAGDAKRAQLGDAARIYSQSLVFCMGPYLVRMVAFQESAEVSQVLLELGRSIEQGLRK
jgi:hypothetical protein